MPEAKNRSRWKELKNALVLFICSLTFIELTLHGLSWSFPQVSRLLAGPWRNAEFLPDTLFRLRGNPLYVGHDSAGYRNQTRPAQADIITLGDSNTYGVLVGFDEVWPRVLAGEIRDTVYNMGVDAYGPGEYFLQLDEALSLQPRRLILAFYFGNDLFDAFAFSSRQPQLVGPIDEELKETADRLEAEYPIEAEFNRAFGIEDKNAQPKTSRDSWSRVWISQNVKLYGLVRAFKYGFLQAKPMPFVSSTFKEAAGSLSPIQREYFSLYEGPAWRTILGSGYRSLLIDTRDPRVQVGLEVTQRLLELIAERCRNNGVSFHVVLLPTKDNVFWPYIPDPENHKSLRQQVMDEEQLKKKLIFHMRKHGIDFIDLLEPLKNASVQPYFENADGHPNAAGHQIIAQTIAAHLSQGEQVDSIVRKADAARSPSSGMDSRRKGQANF